MSETNQKQTVHLTFSILHSTFKSCKIPLLLNVIIFLSILFELYLNAKYAY